ncbi:MAG TPA: alpha/beta hydrolase [Stackebrandtia sp.]|uniref:alpha/beta hydrolase n=1 Tax=Stackebrandtia sp. TaxID=2023065 RepID=UPI002D244FD0|nr:alpha/beta hydrolase [Stackebrandtia sp.]HZE38534.1 alpha/beta hydrolase [Stackebrandtia sp.]
METDELGEKYRRRTIHLDADAEGDVVATLVHRVDSPVTGKAVMYVHGFSDYFFHPHVADFFIERGFAFYAIDLRKAGRSLLPHQTPHFVRYIPEYFAELDAASNIIRGEDLRESILVYAHSTGALTAALWAHRMRKYPWLSGLILNSPFFELNIGDVVQKVGVVPLDIAGLLAPKRMFPGNGTSINVESLHSSLRGEWDFNLEWKPLEGTPPRLGWLRGVDRAQRRLRRGLDVRVPVLVAASGASYRDSGWDDAVHTSDAVLDADDIVSWAPKLGADVEVVRIDGGRHDLALSRMPARELFFTEIDTWMRKHSLIS